MIGIIIGWCIVAYVLMPLGKIYSAEVVASISTVVFFISSYIRTYFIRRYFNKKVKMKNNIKKDKGIIRLWKLYNKNLKDLPNELIIETYSYNFFKVNILFNKMVKNLIKEK